MYPNSILGAGCLHNSHTTPCNPGMDCWPHIDDTPPNNSCRDLQEKVKKSTHWTPTNLQINCVVENQKNCVTAIKAVITKLNSLSSDE